MSKKLTKVMAFAVCFVFVLSLLAGCGSDKKEETASVTDTTSAGTTTAAAEPEKKETLTLKYFHEWNDKNPIDASLDMVGPVIEKNFAIKFGEIINPTGGEPGEKFRLMITSGDIPDIMLLPFSELSGANKYGTDGLFLDITQLKDQFANLKDLYTPYITRTLSATDGKIYALPVGAWQTAKDYNYNKEGMWIKKSVKEKLNLDVSTIKTPEDLLALCERIKTEIKTAPDGNPIIPYGLGAEGWGDSKFFMMYGADWHNLMPDDKSITFLPTHPGAKEGVRMLYRMINKGYMEKDAFLQKDAQWREKLAQGRFAIIMHAPSIVYDDLNPLFQKTNPDDEYLPISFPWGAQLHKYFWYPENPPSITMFSAKLKEPERVLEMCDWTATEEGYLAVSNGTDGVFYTMKDGKAVLNEEGAKIKKDGKKKEAYGLNGWYSFAGWGDRWKKLGGMDEDDPRIKEASKTHWMWKQKEDGTDLFPNPDTTCAPQVPFRNDGWGILFPIWKDAQAKALIAKSEEAAMEIWDKAVVDMNKQAGDKMTEQFEAEYQKQLQILLDDKVAQEEAKKLAASLE